MYVIIITQPDIIFAVSQLACYFTNPGSIHQAAADQTLLYLKRHWDLDLQLDRGNEYVVANDTSFTDNSID